MMAVAAPGFTPVLDQPHLWAHESTWRRPSFDVESFQKKIDEIVGLSVKGDSIVKLRYMRDMECYEKVYTDWDSIGTPIKSDLRARYKALTLRLPDGDLLDIPPPRWVLEQRYEPEQIALSWEKERWETVDGIARPLKDACPGNGYYNWLWTIASHRNCCEDGIQDGAVCWGYYRKPNEQDLTTLKAMMWRKRSDNLDTNPFEAPSLETETKVINRQFAEDKEVEDKKRALQKEIIHDAIKQNLWKHTDDPGVLKHGKYHFLTSKKEKKNVESN